jgi:hypothetical protein
VYHHTGMVLTTWAAVKYLPGGHGILLGTIFNKIINKLPKIVIKIFILLICDVGYKKIQLN